MAVAEGGNENTPTKKTLQTTEEPSLSELRQMLIYGWAGLLEKYTCFLWHHRQFFCNRQFHQGFASFSTATPDHSFQIVTRSSIRLLPSCESM